MSDPILVFDISLCLTLYLTYLLTDNLFDILLCLAIYSKVLNVNKQLNNATAKVAVHITVLHVSISKCKICKIHKHIYIYKPCLSSYIISLSIIFDHI